MQTFDSKNVGKVNVCSKTEELKNSVLSQKQNSLVPNTNIWYNFYLAGLTVISLSTI